MSIAPEPLSTPQRNGPPFSFDEIAAAVRLSYDEPQASEQLALWEGAFRAASEDADTPAAWFFSVELMAALVVARPETASRVALLRPRGDAAFEAEVERGWQAALASAHARAGRLLAMREGDDVANGMGGTGAMG